MEIPVKFGWIHFTTQEFSISFVIICFVFIPSKTISVLHIDKLQIRVKFTNYKNINFLSSKVSLSWVTFMVEWVVYLSKKLWCCFWRDQNTTWKVKLPHIRKLCNDLSVVIALLSAPLIPNFHTFTLHLIHPDWHISRMPFMLHLSNHPLYLMRHT